MAKNLVISPENLTIANAYLEFGGAAEAAMSLGITPREVTDTIEKGEIKRYIDAIYLDSGYRNRFKLAEVMDKLLDMKLEEMDETEMGSKKDILEVLAFAHKMRQDEMKLETERMKAANGPATTQVNIGDMPFQGKYGELMQQLIVQDEE